MGFIEVLREEEKISEMGFQVQKSYIISEYSKIPIKIPIYYPVKMVNKNDLNITRKLKCHFHEIQFGAFTKN